LAARKFAILHDADAAADADAADDNAAALLIENLFVFRLPTMEMASE